jgi:hypothetical protein
MSRGREKVKVKSFVRNGKRVKAHTRRNYAIGLGAAAASIVGVGLLARRGQLKRLAANAKVKAPTNAPVKTVISSSSPLPPKTLGTSTPKVPASYKDYFNPEKTLITTYTNRGFSIDPKAKQSNIRVDNLVALSKNPSDKSWAVFNKRDDGFFDLMIQIPQNGRITGRKDPFHIFTELPDTVDPRNLKIDDFEKTILENPNVVSAIKQDNPELVRSEFYKAMQNFDFSPTINKDSRIQNIKKVRGLYKNTDPEQREKAFNKLFGYE